MLSLTVKHFSPEAGKDEEADVSADSDSLWGNLLQVRSDSHEPNAVERHHVQADVHCVFFELRIGEVLVRDSDGALFVACDDSDGLYHGNRRGEGAENFLELGGLLLVDEL